MTQPLSDKTCPGCGVPNSPDCRFCTGCGREFPRERTCSRCKAMIPPEQKFCTACGTPVDTPTGSQQPSGQRKFCRQCRVLIDSDAKFCNSCGTVIANLPVCPRCGDPIGHDEKFCGVCGMPFGAAAPASQTPVRPAQSAPQVIQQTQKQPAMNTSPLRKSGISIGKIAAGVVAVLVILVGIVMLLPDTTTPPPPPHTGGSPTASIVITSDEDKAATQNSIDASNAVVRQASQTLADGDTAAFLSALAPEYRRKVEGSMLNMQNARTIASSLKNAKVVSAFPDIVYYEMTVNNKPYEFYTVMEEGSWKIAGL